ncbi:MAG: hypothetical protein V4695_06775 [Pseudomonadota bacterium]
MKKAELHAFRTLIRIRKRRQESLDKVRVEAQHELSRLMEAVNDAKQILLEAEERVVTQGRLIDKLTEPGSKFQVADYLAQEDYRTFLQQKAVAEQTNVNQAKAAVVQQETVLASARAAAATNARQQERLEERVKAIVAEIDVKKMDDEDEEAEETVVTRKLLKVRKADQDASVDGHA